MIEHQWEPGGLVRRHSGVVTCEDLVQSDAHMRADPRFGEVRYVIDDFRRCVGLQVQGNPCATYTPAAPGVVPAFFRHAAVLTLPLFHKGFALLTLPGHRRIEPFAFMADARDWAIA